LAICQSSRTGRFRSTAEHAEQGASDQPPTGRFRSTAKHAEHAEAET